MTPPLHNLLVFRIEHIDNLEYILRHGMFTRAHAPVNPHHVFIGHAQLTDARNDWPVRPIDAADPSQYGTLGHYVPFYFGPRSPMLYIIQKGFKDVPRRRPQEIVYLCCRFRTIAEAGVPFVFTDGHAKTVISAVYSKTENLNLLDWDTIYARNWSNRPDGFDRERRKQAELLVPVRVPPEWIEVIVVYDDGIRTFAENLIQQNNHKATVRVNPKDAYNGCGFYY